MICRDGLLLPSLQNTGALAVNGVGQKRGDFGDDFVLLSLFSISTEKHGYEYCLRRVSSVGCES